MFKKTKIHDLAKEVKTVAFYRSEVEKEKPLVKVLKKTTLITAEENVQKTRNKTKHKLNPDTNANFTTKTFNIQLNSMPCKCCNTNDERNSNLQQWSMALLNLHEDQSF